MCDICEEEHERTNATLDRLDDLLSNCLEAVGEASMKGDEEKMMEASNERVQGENDGSVNERRRGENNGSVQRKGTRGNSGNK